MQTLIPSYFLADIQVLADAVLVAKAIVDQYNNLTYKKWDQRIETFAAHVEPIPVLSHNATEVVDEPTILVFNCPASLVFIFSQTFSGFSFRG